MSKEHQRSGRALRELTGHVKAVEVTCCAALSSLSTLQRQFHALRVHSPICLKPVRVVLEGSICLDISLEGEQANVPIPSGKHTQATDVADQILTNDDRSSHRAIDPILGVGTGVMAYFLWENDGRNEVHRPDGRKLLDLLNRKWNNQRPPRELLHSGVQPPTPSTSERLV